MVLPILVLVGTTMAVCELVSDTISSVDVITRVVKGSSVVESKELPKLGVAVGFMSSVVIMTLN